MDRWVDSLSEDWVSQPRASDSQSPSVLGNSSPSSIASQSRIPRYKQRSSSNLGTRNADSPKRRSSGVMDKSMKIALSEKTPSHLNAHPQSPAGTGNSKSPLSGSKTASRRRISNSTPPLIQDTVQHKPSRASPLKNQNLQVTPDWKRRVLRGNIETGQQQDLFSPIGLENIFRPPTHESKAKQKRVPKKFEPSSVEAYPSSPPPYPSSANSALGTQRRDVKIAQSTSLEKGKNYVHSVAGEVVRKPAVGKPRNADAQGGLVKAPSFSSATPPIDFKAQQGPNSESPRTRSHRKGDQPSSLEGSRSSLAVKEKLVSNAKTFSARGRHPSGEEENRNEAISPFIVSRHNTVDGRVDYAAIDTSMQLLHTQMDQLRLQQQNTPRSRTSDDGISYADDGSLQESLLPSFLMNDCTSHSLPDDLSTGTEAFASNGGFVNVHRGGYSNDGSFQRRPLSPSSLPDFDNSQLKSSISSEKITDELLPAPRTPKRRQIENPSSSENLKSSGSPLKLFDKYDTFTNNRLARRMSKFEETLPDSQDEDLPSNAVVNSKTPNAEPQASIASDRRCPQPQLSERSQAPAQNRISSFGDGNLDGYDFSSQRSTTPSGKCSQGERRAGQSQGSEERHHDVRPDQILSPQSFTPNSVAKGGKGGSRSAALRTSGSHLPDQKRIPIHQSSHGDQARPEINSKIKNLGDVEVTAQGKRMPYSPLKDPQPKRRRTLRGTEDTSQEAHLIDQAMEAPLLKSTLGRKRKDALYDSGSQAADPRIIAMRQILRPRISTSGHSGSQGQHSMPEKAVCSSELYDEGQDKIDSEPQDLLLSAIVDSPTKILAGELASFTLDMAQDMTYGARKASVTTADFFNEAQQIMRLLRAQGRPQSRKSPEESESDHDGNLEEPSVQESTKDGFSRPPSREGMSLRRLREPAQVDARVISHLRKFEERDEHGVVLSSLLKLVNIEQSKNENRVSASDGNAHIHGSDVASDPPNLRILDHATQLHKRKHSFSSIQDNAAMASDIKVRSYGSQSTSGPSTGRSIPTGSSRGSGNRAVIAPETVSHLLSDHVAGMTFDHAKQVWIKRRSISSKDGAEADTHTGSEVTEEDLFREIPDLSVDELEELERTKAAAYSIKVLGSYSDRVSNHDHAIQAEPRSMSAGPTGDPSNSRPHTADGQILGPLATSSAPSKFSRFTSSGPTAETRATSWGDNVLAHKDSMVVAPIPPAKSPRVDDEHAEEVEHEISILEGRVSRSPARSNGKQRQARVVTVAFSSPLIDPMQTPYMHNDMSEHWEEDSALNLDDSPIRYDCQPDTSTTRRPTQSGLGRRSSHRGASRRVSIGNQSYLARPMSRLDEQEEISFLRCSDMVRNSSMDVVLSTPLPPRGSFLIPPPPSTGQQSSIGFHLSPLPDFTVHQVDNAYGLDLDQVANRHSVQSMQKVEGRISLATQDLVKILTDIEPYEPYWDYIRKIELQRKGLLTLHMLHGYCGRIEELDVSDNELGQLNGAPSSIRHLRIRRNCLSNLTSWGHLYNLQYLDISGNQVQSLKGFLGLVHLRELRADDNQIESLDGVTDLDGLIRLRLRRNFVRTVDFEGSNLKRLVSLDLHANKLVEVSHLDLLPALKHLNLSENELKASASSPWTPLSALETLNLSNNKLSTIDVSSMPNLRTLNIDKNSIAHLQGLPNHQKLETLSWCEQTLLPASGFADLQYQHCHELQNLYLSNNPIPTFTPSTPFLNLHHLELASTGLQSLSPDLGLQMPNLRVLNLNYNALHDLRPLLGILRLREVYLAGNRISRLRRTAAVLDRLGTELLEIDLRRNPLTVGFYTPQASTTSDEKRLILQSSRPQESDSDSDSDSINFRKQLQPHILPPTNKAADTLSRERLDEDTKLRRRVYEMLLVSGCKSLEKLDGMGVERGEVGRRDGVWERLVEVGVLRAKKRGSMEENAAQEEEEGQELR